MPSQNTVLSTLFIIHKYRNSANFKSRAKKIDYLFSSLKLYNMFSMSPRYLQTLRRVKGDIAS